MSNIVGVLNFSKFDITGIMVINISIVISIFFLLTFTRLLIREKEDKKSLGKAIVLVIIFILISIFTIAKISDIDFRYR